MGKAFWHFFGWVKMGIKAGCMGVLGVKNSGFPKVTILAIQGLQAVFLKVKNKFRPGKRIEYATSLHYSVKILHFALIFSYREHIFLGAIGTSFFKINLQGEQYLSS